MAVSRASPLRLPLSLRLRLRLPLRLLWPAAALAAVLLLTPAAHASALQARGAQSEWAWSDEAEAAEASPLHPGVAPDADAAPVERVKRQEDTESVGTDQKEGIFTRLFKKVIGYAKTAVAVVRMFVEMMRSGANDSQGDEAAFTRDSAETMAPDRLHNEVAPPFDA